MQLLVVTFLHNPTCGALWRVLNASRNLNSSQVILSSGWRSYSKYCRMTHKQQIKHLLSCNTCTFGNESEKEIIQAIARTNICNDIYDLVSYKNSENGKMDEHLIDVHLIYTVATGLECRRLPYPYLVATPWREGHIYLGELELFDAMSLSLKLRTMLDVLPGWIIGKLKWTSKGHSKLGIATSRKCELECKWG